MQSTPEKKRLSWNPILEEIVWHDSAVAGEEARSNLVRYNMSKECDSLLDPAGHVDDMCLALLQERSAEAVQASVSLVALRAFQGPESASRDDVPANLKIIPSPALPPACTEAPGKEGNEEALSGVLSEEEKHAGMKRRYSMLQQNLRMPAEEERRLKRERLRSLVPIWSKTRADAQSLDGGKH